MEWWRSAWAGPAGDSSCPALYARRGQPSWAGIASLGLWSQGPSGPQGRAPELRVYGDDRWDCTVEWTSDDRLGNLINAAGRTCGDEGR